MTKAELIRKLAEELDIARGKAEAFVDTLGSILAAELLGGGEALLPGIGNFNFEIIHSLRRSNRGIPKGVTTFFRRRQCDF